MNNPNEADLLRGAKEYDQKALGEIYDRFSPGLYGYAMRLLGDQCLAEDCVADTFARFLKALRAGQGPDLHLQAYLYRVAHNWVTDHYRRQPLPPIELRENILGADRDRPEIQAGQRMEENRVRAALRMLTPDQRQVIMLRFLEGWENEDVSAAVGKPVSAVKALQHRGLAALRKWLLGDEKETDYAYE